MAQSTEKRKKKLRAKAKKARQAAPAKPATPASQPQLIKSDWVANELLFEASANFPDGLNFQLAALALAQGADINATDPDGRTPLHWASRASMTQFLLKAGANPFAKSHVGAQPIHTARTAEQTDLLIEAGADPNAAGLRGTTPLHAAKSVAQAKRLLAAGANLWALTTLGQTTAEIVRIVAADMETPELQADVNAAADFLEAQLAGEKLETATTTVAMDAEAERKRAQDGRF